MKEITVTVEVEDKLYARAMNVNLAVSRKLHDFLEDEGMEYLEEQVEDLEDATDLTAL